MLLTVNSEQLALPDRERISIPELLAHLQVENPAFSTIIVNGKPLVASKHNDIILHNADRIEILQYVAGG